MLLALLVAGGALLYAAVDATADGEPYKTSLNAPVKFPVDI